MEIVVLTKDAHQDIVNRIISLDKFVKQLISPSKEIFLDNQEFMQRLKISKRTAQTWRDEGKVSFSQIGNKIYYLESDIEQLIKENYLKAFNPTKRSNSFLK